MMMRYRATDRHRVIAAREMTTRRASEVDLVAETVIVMKKSKFHRFVNPPQRTRPPMLRRLSSFLIGADRAGAKRAVHAG